MKRILFLVFVVAALWGCDYSIVYEYKVANATQRTLEMRLPGNRPDAQRSVLIRPGATVQVYIHSAFLGGEHDIPVDVIPGDSLLPPCGVYDFTAAGEPIPEHFRQRSYWDFAASERLGVYTLTVTDEMTDPPAPAL